MLNLESVTQWGEPKEVQTKYGPRILRKATPDETFWTFWRQHQGELKAAGISVTKDLRSGQWGVCWWSKVGQDVEAERAATTEASRASTSDFEPPKPEGLNYYPFQKAGIAFINSKPGVLLADDMGIGKTIQAIGVINVHRAEINRVLVVTKASLKENWRRELCKWLCVPMTIGIATGQYWPRDCDVVIINYDVLSKHMTSLRKKEWDLVVLDESAAIKNREAKRTKAVVGYKPSQKKQAEGATVISPIPAKRRLCLSGTPIENRPEELWTSLFYLDPQRWPSFWSYAKRYCAAKDTGWGMDTSGASNLDELQRILRSTIMIRRKKSEVLTELPAKTRQVIELDSEGLEDVIEADKACFGRCQNELEEAQAQIELAKASDSEEEFKEAVQRLTGANFAFTEMARVRHETAVSKVPQMIEAIKEDLEECSKIIVFGHHHDVLGPIHAAFPGSVMITGQTPPEDRQAICDVFQTNPACRVFVGSIRACGEGLTLTAANLVVFAEQDWTPGKVSQAEDRAHRIGQRDNVLVKHYVLPGTIDAKMIKTVVEKQGVIDQVMDKDPGDWAEAPILVPKHEPLVGKKKEIAEEALLITARQIELIHAGLQSLAGMCDGARQIDGHGFNKIDTHIGKALAQQGGLSPKQAALGRRLCRKYQKQLGRELVNEMFTTPQ